MTEEFQRKNVSGGCHDNNHNNNNDNDNNNSVSPIPPPTVIERVKIDKVYEECKVVDTNEITRIIGEEKPVKDLVPENIEDIVCIKAELDPDSEVECDIVNKKLVQLKFTVRVKFKIYFEDDTDPVTRTTLEQKEKIVRLSRAGEEGLDPQCEIFLECLDAFVSTDEDDKPIIVLCVGELILFKLYANVQLLIPAYGFAPQPPECPEVLEECPEYEPVWPPWPEQF